MKITGYLESGGIVKRTLGVRHKTGATTISREGQEIANRA